VHLRGLRRQLLGQALLRDREEKPAKALRVVRRACRRCCCDVMHVEAQAEQPLLDLGQCLGLSHGAAFGPYPVGVSQGAATWPSCCCSQARHPSKAVDAIWSGAETAAVRHSASARHSSRPALPAPLKPSLYLRKVLAAFSPFSALPPAAASWLSPCFSAAACCSCDHCPLNSAGRMRSSLEQQRHGGAQQEGWRKGAGITEKRMP